MNTPVLTAGLAACGLTLWLAPGATFHVSNSGDDAGIRVSGGQGHRVEGCDIHDTGTGGLVLEGGDRKTLTPAGHQAINNHIWQFSRHPLTSAYGLVLGGVGNRAENNLFIECQRALGSAPWNDQRWKETIEGGHDCHWPELLRREVDITRPPYTTHYPELAGFMEPQPGQVRVNRAKNNVFFRCGEVSSGNWKYAAEESWVTDADSGFVDASDGDFRLRPDAKVFQRLPGFKPIPFEKIGLLDQRANADATDRSSAARHFPNT